MREKVQAQTWEDTHDAAAAATFAVSPECLMLIPIRALGTCPLGLERRLPVVQHYSGLDLSFKASSSGGLSLNPLP